MKKVWSINNKIICDYRDKCTSSLYHCRTCLRNKANKYEDKFSMSPEGYSSMEKWERR